MCPCTHWVILIPLNFVDGVAEVDRAVELAVDFISVAVAVYWGAGVEVDWSDRQWQYSRFANEYTTLTPIRKIWTSMLLIFTHVFGTFMTFMCE